MNEEYLWLMIKGTKEDTKLGSGHLGKDEAANQLATVGDAIGSAETIRLPWIVINGENVIAAYLAGANG